jgi:hypothetical protein
MNESTIILIQSLCDRYEKKMDEEYKRHEIGVKHLLVEFASTYNDLMLKYEREK